LSSFCLIFVIPTKASFLKVVPVVQLIVSNLNFRTGQFRLRHLGEALQIKQILHHNLIFFIEFILNFLPTNVCIQFAMYKRTSIVKKELQLILNDSYKHGGNLRCNDVSTRGKEVLSIKCFLLLKY